MVALDFAALVGGIPVSKQAQALLTREPSLQPELHLLCRNA
jgi:hypothetical protein